jgi:chromosome segregation ATPase
MAEEIIGIKITTDANKATEDVKKLDNAFDETDKSVKSLRTQLKEAQADVGLLADKFGATSKEAINAAKRAADLKDRIGDA